MKLELLYLKAEECVDNTQGVKNKLCKVLLMGLGELIYYRFEFLRKVADKYPRLAYYLLKKNEFNPVLDFSFLIADIYKKKGKTIIDYMSNLTEFRIKMHTEDDKYLF